MTNKPLNNPHDRFFRHTFTHPDVARPFFQRYLPAEIRERLDFSTLHPEKDSFIDTQLADHHADLLFSIQQHDGESARLYLLLEHKSYDAPWAGLQLLDYLLRIWMHEKARLKSPPLPPIIGLVLYHGEGPWTGGNRFASLVNAPGPLGIYTPDFRFILCDLCREQLDGLQQRARLAIALQVLKLARSHELPARLPEILALFRQLADHRDDALAYLGTVLRYILRVAGQVDQSTLESALHTTLPADMGESIMPTIAETLMEEGELRYARRMLRRQLERRFGPLPESVEQRIAEADQLILDDWMLQVVTVPELRALFPDA